MLVSGIDLGFRNCALVAVRWTPRARRCVFARTIRTSADDPDSIRWRDLLCGIRNFIDEFRECDFVACGEMTGVRHGKDARHQTSANSDPLIELQGAVRMACATYGKELRLVRDASIYSAIGARILTVAGEDRHKKSTRQKAATAHRMRVLLAGAEALTEHEHDACAAAVAAILGKGQTA